MKHILTLTSLFVISVLASAFACSIDLNKKSGSNTAIVQNINTESMPAGEPSAAGAESQSVTAAAVVADLYKQHDAKKSPFFQTKNRALVDKFFTKTLGDLIWKDARNSSGEVGAIDADPLYYAQDIEIKNFAIGTADVKGDSATVPVTFTNYGEKKAINFWLKKVGDQWKIDNILYGAGDSLMKWLNETYPDMSPSKPTGEFQGKFLVGDTSCTVKPVKMAFEVRWAKGSGVETFFFKEGYTFESSGKGGPNRFEFDDEGYTTGTFYRADGKVFPIVRAK